MQVNAETWLIKKISSTLFGYPVIRYPDISIYTSNIYRIKKISLHISKCVIYQFIYSPQLDVYLPHLNFYEFTVGGQIQTTRP